VSGPEILDSEMLSIEKVLETLRRRAEDGRRLDRGRFDQEIVERFGQIGFKVDVKWWHTNLDEVKMPEIEIIGRTETKAFDHDQMAHEVTSDILELGTGGVIKMGSEDAAMIRATEQAHKRQHVQGVPHDHGDGKTAHGH
jgi:hypothetical protein